MQTATFAVTLYAFALATHWVRWRIRLPTRQTRALLWWLLIVSPAIFLGAAFVFGLASDVPRSLPDILQAGLFHVSMSLAYIVTYSALEEESPTLAIVKHVATAGPTGRSLDDLRQIINDDLIVSSRVTAAVRDGLIRSDGALLELTPKGRRIARMFRTYRRILGTQKGT